MKVHRLTKNNKLKSEIYMQIRNNKLVSTPRNNLIASGFGTNLKL